MFLIGDMHNYKSRIDFTLFWVLKNQYYASTGVAPGGQIQPSGDSYKTSGVLKRVAPGGKQGWQNGSGPTDRPASPSVNTWARSRNSARQPETARPVKPAGPSGQLAGQNGPARGPYHLIKKQHVHIFSVSLPHTHSAPRHLTHFAIASLLLDSSLRSLLLHPRRSGSISTS